MFGKFESMVFKSKEEEIKFRKLSATVDKTAALNAAVSQCYHCGANRNLINSHSIPAFMLRYIAENGKLFSLNKILNDPGHQEKGINNSGTFRLLCANCDSQLFKLYENESNYSSPPTAKLLSQIVMKNSLKLIYKQLLGIERYKEQLKLKDNIFSQKALIRSMEDLKGYQNDYINAVTISEGKNNYGYELICHEILNYKTPIAFQDQLVLIMDFNNQFVYDVYQQNINLEPLNICVFPLHDKTVILGFTKKSARKYKDFKKQFTALKRVDRLSTINYLIFCYCEDFFIRGNINPEIFNDSNLIDVCRTYTYQNIEDAQWLFGLKRRHDIPNLLSKNYAVK